MSRTKRRTVKWQSKSVKETTENYNGERSPYWDWLFNNNKPDNSKDGINEPAEANPDILPEQMGGVNTEPLHLLIKKERFALLHKLLNKLSARELSVIQSLSEGKTEHETASLLSISRSSVRNYLRRIRKKLKVCVTNF